MARKRLRYTRTPDWLYEEHETHADTLVRIIEEIGPQDIRHIQAACEAWELPIGSLGSQLRSLVSQGRVWIDEKDRYHAT